MSISVFTLKNSFHIGVFTIGNRPDLTVLNLGVAVSTALQLL